MAPKLEKVLTSRFVISKENMLLLGNTKGGASRCVTPIIDGFLKGDGINATLLPGGSDWPVVNQAAGVTYLDGRGHFRDNETGDTFYVRLEGILRMDESAQMAFSWSPDAKSTKAGDHYWFTTPIFEVSNGKHKWMEQSWFVSQGHWHIPGDGTQAAEHGIYRVVNG